MLRAACRAADPITQEIDKEKFKEVPVQRLDIKIGIGARYKTE